uniref:FBD domain-containing protein n=1 Tax=Triticum urartu TaxID=4572 RepID=A0A8R7QIV3_TRIUA
MKGSPRKGKDACSQPPRVHVLCLQISAQDQSGPVLNFARELEKLPVSNFTILALNLNAEGHVLAAFVSRILGMHHLQTSIQRLKVVLCNWSEMSKCIKHCPCNEPKNWRSYIISLTRLEEVEIYKFRGGDHEIDLVTMILSWAPMLTRMTIRLTHEINPSDIGDCAKSIYKICFGHPFVNSFVYLSNGELVPCSQM